MNITSWSMIIGKQPQGLVVVVQSHCVAQHNNKQDGLSRKNPPFLIVHIN
jgi:hypothetical protein